MQNVRIRTPHDNEFEQVHALVHELAIFEKAPEHHITTPEQYLEDYRNGWFEVEVALVEEEIVGMIFYYQTYSTWKGRMLYLEDFVVRSAWRGKGIGHQLFERFLQIARERNCVLAKWQVLDWNEKAIRFYEREGASIEKGWWNGKMMLDQ